MNRKITLGAAIAYTAIIAAIVYSIAFISATNQFNEKISDIQTREETYDKLEEVDLWIKSNYYQTTDDSILLDGAAEGYISALGDEHSRYLSAKEYQQYLNVVTNEQIGIGIETELSEDGFIRVTAVYPDSPAYYGNIVVGDIIVEVDGVDVTIETYEELAAKLPGATGSVVSVTLRRVEEDIKVELVRREVAALTIDSYMIEQSMYLRVLSVTGDTAEQMERAISTAVSGGAESIVLDIRGIATSSIEYVAGMIDIFASEGNTVLAVYSNGTTEVLASSDIQQVSLPLTVLADEKTSGAIEILAQFAKEQTSADVVGVTTAGYGSIQDDYKLSDGSAIILTTSLYATPSGTTYDGVGVSPTYEIRWQVTDEEKEFLIGVPESDPQLRKAIEILLAAAATTEQTSQPTTTG